MTLRKKLFSLLLAGAMVLSLAACVNTGSTGATGSGSDTGASPSPSMPPLPTPPEFVSRLPEDFVADTSAEDLCLALLGLPGDQELLTVNGVPVNARTYLYWLRENLAYLGNVMYYYYGSALDAATVESMADQLKSASHSSAVQHQLLMQKAKELDLEMTPEQIAEMDADIAEAAQSVGGQEEFLKILHQQGFDYDTFYSVNSSTFYYANLLDGLFAGRPTQEEMETYVKENDILVAKHILLMTVDPTTREPLDEATVAQKKAQAADILAQLQKSTDLEADFDRLMNEHSEDPGLASYPDGYTFTAGEMVPEFEQATRDLEYGQISGIVESASTGCHIILRLDPITEELRAQQLDALMDEQVNTWVSEAQITLSDEFASLDIVRVYETLTAYQEAFALLEDAGAEPESETEN